MRHFAHIGHAGFVLRLGCGGRAVNDHSLDYHEPHVNHFVLSPGGREIETMSTDVNEWVCVRTATGGRVDATPYDGFWAPLDTVHERPARAELHYWTMSHWAPWHTNTAASAGSSGSHHSFDLPDVVGPTPTR
jgi:hypothetical protein